MRLFAEELVHGDAAVRAWASEFGIDEGVVEASAGGIGGSGGVEDASGTSPVDGAEAHGARLASAVEIATGKLEIAQDVAGLADGDDFGVGGGIVGGGDAVGTFSDDAVAFDDESGERAAAAGTDVFDGECDGATHEAVGGGRRGHGFQLGAGRANAQPFAVKMWRKIYGAGRDDLARMKFEKGSLARMGIGGRMLG